MGRGLQELRHAELTPPMTSSTPRPSPVDETPGLCRLVLTCRRPSGFRGYTSLFFGIRGFSWLPSSLSILVPSVVKVYLDWELVELVCVLVSLGLF
jgi:hypothetical protein